jgi:hypothetical protein
MDQNPLPRGSFQIRDRTGEELRIAVAVDAQYPAHPAGAMMSIDVLTVGRDKSSRGRRFRSFRV